MIKTLLAVRLRSLISGLRGKKKDGSQGGGGKLVLLLIAYIYIGAVFLFMFGAAAFIFAPFMISAGLDALYFALFMLISFSLIFFLSIFETKAQLFECRDNELLMSMPIKPGDIVISRILVVLILNYIEAALVFLPAVIAYAVFGGSVFGIVGSSFAFLLLPLLATSLSSGVGYIVAAVAKKFKNNSFIPLVFSLAFLGLYFWGYSVLLSVPESELENLENLIPTIEAAFAPVSAIGLSAMLHPVATPIFAVISLGGAYIAYRVIAAGFGKLASAGGAAAKKKYKAEAQRTSSQFFALVKKEFARFISSATYMLNGGFGAIMYVVVAVAGASKSAELSYVIQSFLLGLGFTIDIKTALPVVIIAVFVLLSSTVTISASAFSLEGKSFSILKSMPVGASTVILAKLVPHIVVSAVGSLVASIIMIVSLGIEPIYAIFVIVTPIFANIFAALIGMMMNILVPKLEFDSEIQVIKQSAAVGLTMLVTMLFGLIYLGVSVLFVISDLSTFMIFLSAPLLLVFVVASAVIVFVPLKKRVESISA